MRFTHIDINFDITYVTSISLYQLDFLNTLQLPAGAIGLSSQGVTAVVHGCSVHALGPTEYHLRIFSW